MSAETVESVSRSHGVAGLVARTNDFLTAVRDELRKVTWPSRPELISATRMVLILSVLLGIAIGLLDWVLQLILVDGVARLTR